MIDAIRAKDVARADRLAQDHSRQFRDRFLDFLRANFTSSIDLVLAVSSSRRWMLDALALLLYLFGYNDSSRATMISRRSFTTGLLAAVTFAGLAPPAAASEKVTVFAAASLKNALDEVSAAWTVETGKQTSNSYAASSALASSISSAPPRTSSSPPTSTG